MPAALLQLTTEHGVLTTHISLGQKNKVALRWTSNWATFQAFSDHISGLLFLDIMWTRAKNYSNRG